MVAGKLFDLFINERTQSQANLKSLRLCPLVTEVLRSKNTLLSDSNVLICFTLHGFQTGAQYSRIGRARLL